MGQGRSLKTLYDYIHYPMSLYFPEVKIINNKLRDSPMSWMCIYYSMDDWKSDKKQEKKVERHETK